MLNRSKHGIRFVVLCCALIGCFAQTPMTTITPVLPTPIATAAPLPSPAVSRGRMQIPFNPDWKYKQSDVSGAFAQDFDDSTWAYVDLPHSTTFVTPEHP